MFSPRLTRAALLGAVFIGVSARLSAQKPSPNLHEVWSALSDSGVFQSPRSLVVTSDCTVWIADPRTGVWRLSCNFGGAPTKVEADTAGPHNLRMPWLVAPFRGDTVAIWDRELQHVALFAPGGTFLREQPLRLVEAVTGRPIALSVPLADRSWRAWTVTSPGGPGARMEHRSYVLSILADGSVADSVAAMPGTQSIFYDTAGMFGGIDAPLQRKPLVTFFRNGGFIAGANDRAQLDVFDAAGQKQHTITLPLPVPGRVTRTDREAFADSTRRALERDMDFSRTDDTSRAQLRQIIEPLLRAATYPEVRQRFDQIMLDETESAVWVLLPGTGAGYERTWFICSLTDYSFCRTQLIAHQGAVVAATIHDGALYAIEQTRDGMSRVAKYASQ